MSSHFSLSPPPILFFPPNCKSMVILPEALCSSHIFCIATSLCWKQSKLRLSQLYIWNPLLPKKCRNIFFLPKIYQNFLLMPLWLCRLRLQAVPMVRWKVAATGMRRLSLVSPKQSCHVTPSSLQLGNLLVCISFLTFAAQDFMWLNCACA